MKNNIPKELFFESGIYEIRNTLNGRIYIGSTSLFRRRYYNHLYPLQDVRRKCNVRLRSDYIKFGGDNFEFNVLCHLPKLSDETIESFNARLLSKEDELILHHRSNQRQYGYNIRLYVGSCRGMKWSEEAKLKNRIRRQTKQHIERRFASLRGSDNLRSKLGADLAKKIKVLIEKGYPMSQIASHYGVDCSIVWSMNGQRKTYSNINPTKEEIDSFQVPNLARKARQHLSDLQVKEVKYLGLKKVRNVIIGEMLNIDTDAISSICSGKSFKNISLTDEDIQRIGERITGNHIAMAINFHDEKIRQSYAIRNTSPKKNKCKINNTEFQSDNAT